MDCVHWRESCGADPVGNQKGVSIAVPTVCEAPCWWLCSYILHLIRPALTLPENSTGTHSLRLSTCQ